MEKILQGAVDLGYLDTLSRGQTPIHKLDPRVKITTTLAFIVLVVSHEKYALSALVPFLCYPLFIAIIGEIPITYLARKVAYLLPFAVLLGVFNPLIDSQPLFTFESISISGGWVSLLSIILRAILTVSAAIVLIAVTGMHAICAGLERMGVPKVFVVQLMFLYRYLFVLVEEAASMTRARAFRSITKRGRSLRSFGPLVGHLFLRTTDRARRIHLAMISRGFTGEIKLIKPIRMGLRDLIFVAGWLAFLIFIRTVNVAHVFGELMLGAVQLVTIS